MEALSAKSERLKQNIFLYSSISWNLALQVSNTNPNINTYVTLITFTTKQLAQIYQHYQILRQSTSIINIETQGGLLFQETIFSLFCLPPLNF